MVQSAHRQACGVTVTSHSPTLNPLLATAAVRPIHAQFDWLCREKIADGPLIAKWRKPGYELLCSMLAIQKGNHNFGTTSHCRVPLRLRASQVSNLLPVVCHLRGGGGRGAGRRGVEGGGE